MNTPLRITLLISVIVLVGAGCGSDSSDATSATEDVSLKYWRVFDDVDTLDSIIDDYRDAHSNVKISYTKWRFEEYEDELIRAFAEGRGPDMFTIHNTWMSSFEDLIMPMPESITTSSLEQQGTVRKETVTVVTTEETMSLRELKSDYVEQVASDVVMDYQATSNSDVEDRIFGLPLALDTLALFYNKDLLDAAGIARPPGTWSDFQDDVELLTSIDSEGNINQSGAAIGTSDNVDRAMDILTLLMMQNGTDMTDSRGRVSFHVIPDDAPEDVYPGLDATEFYTDFANPTKSVYTWNDEYSDSFDAFANGETAFFFGYSYHIPLIRTVAPKLNFAIDNVPQISGAQEVNFANYWVEVVSKDTEDEDWAWGFILYAADEDNVGSYLDEAGKPTALRSLISSQLDDEMIGPFAEQVLTATSWYHGSDIDAAEEALNELIDNILSGIYEGEDAIELAASKVSQTYE